ncbi:MAG: rhodanese-like domain-containing protein [Saprospiraceae bacterium]|nr:rhodanese-like domain-containing protein [Saprospiraceae bacterium]
MGILSNLFGFGTGNTDLSKMIQLGAFLVDVRTQAEFSAGTFKGAVNIPLDTLERNISKFKGKENIIVFCRSGARSAQAKSILLQHGIQNVFNGGAWDELARLVK